jgi:hypothetical protein
MRLSNGEILSMTDDDWSEIIWEIGYPHIPKTLSEKRRVYLDYLMGNVCGNQRTVREEVLE